MEAEIAAGTAKPSTRDFQLPQKRRHQQRRDRLQDLYSLFIIPTRNIEHADGPRQLANSWGNYGHSVIHTKTPCIRTLELWRGYCLGAVNLCGKKSRILQRDFFGISQILPYVIAQKPLGFVPVTCC